MKWYFALNEASLKGKGRALWAPMITAAVRSAKQHTTLRPYFIYDGGDDPFLDELESWGVTIVRHRVSFYESLAAHPTDNDLYLRIASGAFLRTEIPLVETEDEYVLYTDCDVLFQNEVHLDDVRPNFFACAPEFDQTNMVLFNTGVMLMNIPALRSDLANFVAFIKDNLTEFLTFDQCALRQHYGERVDALPLEYNWKPYWGRNDKAAIIHFHGPKPSWARILLEDIEGAKSQPLGDIMLWNVEGYRHYVPRWVEIAEA